MSTSANIQLNNLAKPLAITVSHDGNPENILRLLAVFLDPTNQGQTFKPFKDLYLSDYNSIPNHNVKIQVGLCSDASWGYELSTSCNLRVSCHELWNKHTSSDVLCDPLDHLQVVVQNHRNEIESSIRTSIALLSRMGVSLVLPSTKRPVYLTDGIEITIIDREDISLPKNVLDKKYPTDVLNKMTEEIKLYGWPKGKELGIRQLNDGYEVHASFAWYKAAELAEIPSIPCVIY